MKKIFLLLSICTGTIIVHAQQNTANLPPIKTADNARQVTITRQVPPVNTSASAGNARAARTMPATLTIRKTDPAGPVSPSTGTGAPSVTKKVITTQSQAQQPNTGKPPAQVPSSQPAPAPAKGNDPKQ